jgi:histidine triad (HIT) family protein
MENGCIFCSIAQKQIPAVIVYEDDLVLGALDINPATIGHVILMPKEHFNSLYELPPERSGALFMVATSIGYSLMLAESASSADILYTKELTKGNMTPHVLLHIIPRYNDDTVNYVWQKQTISPQELAEVGEKIRDTLNNINSGNAKPVALTPSAPVSAGPKSAAQQPPQPKQEKPEEKPIELKKRVVII